MLVFSQLPVSLGRRGRGKRFHRRGPGGEVFTREGGKGHKQKRLPCGQPFLIIDNFIY